MLGTRTSGEGEVALFVTDGFRSGAAFTVALEDPRRRHLRCYYQITVLDYLR